MPRRCQKPTASSVPKAIPAAPRLRASLDALDQAPPDSPVAELPDHGNRPQGVLRAGGTAPLSNLAP